MPKQSYMPDVGAIMDSFSKASVTPQEAPPKKDIPPETAKPPTDTGLTNPKHHGHLWKEFSSCLNDTGADTEISRSKSYRIDDDIVCTLHQCAFGKSNTKVINSILRTFLVDNSENLKQIIKPNVKSILDKCNTE